MKKQKWYGEHDDWKFNLVIIVCLVIFFGFIIIGKFLPDEHAPETKQWLSEQRAVPSNGLEW